MITLSKNFIGSGLLRVADSYVTNSKWAIRRTALDEATNTLTATPETARSSFPRADVGAIADAVIESACTPKANSVKLERTEWMRTFPQPGGKTNDAVLYRGAEGTVHAWVDRTFADRLTAESALYAPSTASGEYHGPLTDEPDGSWRVTVMTLRLDVKAPA
jgi:hypothetical protein